MNHGNLPDNLQGGAPWRAKVVQNSKYGLWMFIIDISIVIIVPIVIMVTIVIIVPIVTIVTVACKRTYSPGRSHLVGDVDSARWLRLCHERHRSEPTAGRKGGGFGTQIRRRIQNCNHHVKHVIMLSN